MHTGRKTALPNTNQLRLALIELHRIEREIAELEPRAIERDEVDLLQALRACRATLLRVVDGRMAGARSSSVAPS